MQSAALEHINFTVSDPDKTAALLYELFAVHVRWAGPAKDEGYTVNAGNNFCYLALYQGVFVDCQGAGHLGA